MDYISLNGQLTPYEEARIAPGDAGFLHGAGLFETMRVQAGTIFRLADHLQRLADSAGTLGVQLSLTASQVEEMTADLLEANGLAGQAARLRLTITRGDINSASQNEPAPPMTLVLSASRFTAYPATLYAQGMTVLISSCKQNPQSPLTGHKTTSYLDRLLALHEAQRAGAGEALWFTPRNETLAEGSISNVFIVDKNGTLCTPPLRLPLQGGGPTNAATARLCLPGITRQLVLNLAIEANLLPHERLLTIDDLLSAKEVFLTNAVMGVMPVARVERHPIGPEKPGDITKQLMQAYNDRLTKECSPG